MKPETHGLPRIANTTKEKETATMKRRDEDWSRSFFLE
jgi:hypothetical protein